MRAAEEGEDMAGEETLLMRGGQQGIVLLGLGLASRLQQAIPSLILHHDGGMSGISYI